MSEFDDAVLFAHRMGHIIRAGRIVPQVIAEGATSFLFRWRRDFAFNALVSLEDLRGENEFTGVLEFLPAQRRFKLHLEVSHIKGVSISIASDDLGAFVADKYLTIAQKAECQKRAIHARGQG